MKLRKQDRGSLSWIKLTLFSRAIFFSRGRRERNLWESLILRLILMIDNLESKRWHSWRTKFAELQPVRLTHWGWHLPPLQHHVLGDTSVSVDVNALVLVAHQQLDAVGVGQDDDGVRLDAGLNLQGHKSPTWCLLMTAFQTILSPVTTLYYHLH